MADLLNTIIYGDLQVNNNTSIGGDIAIGGDITVSGNKITFGNGSYMSNESDTCLALVGDSLIDLYALPSASAYFRISTSSILTVKTGESHSRVEINGTDGKISLGSGSAARDTWLYRDAVNSLRTDGALTTNGTIKTLNLGSDNVIAFLGDNGGGAQIFTLSRQAAPSNGTLSITAYGAIGLTAGKTSGGPAISDYHLCVAVDGKVGIGTTSPSHALQIGIGTAGDKISFATSPYGVGYMDTGVTGVFANHDNESARVALGFHNATTFYEKLTVLQNGSVGIGRTNPSYLLDVNGSGRFSGSLSVVSDFVAGNYKFARITFPIGKIKATFTHNLGTTDYVVQISSNTPEAHYYYSDLAANTVVINLDDEAYEQIILDVMVVRTAFTSITATE